MSEDSELQSRIAQLAGRINRHKTNEISNTRNVGTQPLNSHQGVLPSRSGSSFQSAPRASKWSSHRATPYGNSPRRFRGRGYHAGSHRHRTLVLKHGSNIETDPDSLSKEHQEQLPGQEQATKTSSWVTKNDRHMQLFNSSVYAQHSQERAQAIEESRKRKERLEDAQSLAKLQSHLRDWNTDREHSTRDSLAPEVYVNDIRFLVADGGSKLIKANDPTNKLKSTPKRARVGGVAFIRSTHGNLYRAGFIKTTRQGKVPKSSDRCPQFSNTGTCPRGPQCRFTHDPEKVAICREYLLNGSCPAGDSCDLSHVACPERVPACLHFIRGNCTKSDCRYAHVKVNPGAHVCKDFALLGFCSKGANCHERHAHECPDYANKGLCRRKKCSLPHVDRAGQLRKAAAVDEEYSEGDESSDVDSNAGLSDMDSDDVDSDDLREQFEIPPDLSQMQELSKQNDFVRL